MQYAFYCFLLRYLLRKQIQFPILILVVLLFFITKLITETNSFAHPYFGGFIIF